MWSVIKTECEILGGINDKPKVEFYQYPEKYLAQIAMCDVFYKSLKDYGTSSCLYAYCDTEAGLCKICFEQTVIVIAITNTEKKEK